MRPLPGLHQVKICGITLPEQCEEIANLGFGAIGFIFYPPSSRNISPEKAAEMAKKLPVFTDSYAVVVNEPIQKICKIRELFPFTKFQLHGEESPEYCRELDTLRIPWVKAFRVREGFDEKIPDKYPSDTFLLDAYSSDYYGGTGHSFDWQIAQRLTKKYRVILAGGISGENIEEAMKFCNPAAFDLSSKLESAPGVKNMQSIYELHQLLS